MPIYSPISFKPLTYSKLSVASDLSKIGSFSVEDQGKLDSWNIFVIADTFSNTLINRGNLIRFLK